VYAHSCIFILVGNHDGIVTVDLVAIFVVFDSISSVFLSCLISAIVVTHVKHATLLPSICDHLNVLHKSIHHLKLGLEKSCIAVNIMLDFN